MISRVVPFIALTSILAGGMGACSSDDGEMVDTELLGSWSEDGTSRTVTFDGHGSFTYLEDGTEAGGGTYDVDGDELTLHLQEGVFLWGESTNNAPIQFTLSWEVDGDSMTLTFSVMGAVSEVHYTRTG